MSGLSLREARTKRQKAKVYKTSRSEFRSTLNNSRNDQSPEHDGNEWGDDKMTRRKIMKLEEKGTAAETQGEESVGVNMEGITEEENQTKKTEEIINEDTAQGKEDNDDENKEDESKTESSDKKDNKKGKKDDEAGDDGGNDMFNMKKGDGDSNDDKDQDRDDFDGSTKNGEGGSGNQNPDKSNDDKTVQDDKETIAYNVEEDEETEKQKAESDYEEEVHGNNDFGFDPYEHDFEFGDYPSIEEDYYEFLSQDGGSGGDSENSFGDDDEEDELRSAG